MSIRNKRLLLGILLLGSLLLAGGTRAALLKGESALLRSVVGGGGLTMSGGNHAMYATLGQTAIGWSENGHRLGSGFWYGIETERRIYLPLVMKDFAP